MVLEDESMLFGLLEDLLGLEGYRVTKPVSLAELVEEVRADRPDALLIDVNLKEANGLELLSKIRADEELKHIVVLLTSGSDYRRESEERGANGFLMKPYMPEELVTALQQNLNN